MNRKKVLGLASGVVGILLVIAAAVSLVGSAGPVKGNIEQIEADLGDGPSDQTNLNSNVAKRSVESGSPAFTDRPEPAALWQPNPRSTLTEVNQVDEGPYPTRLRIPGIFVDAPVERYGIDSATGQMDVPSNVTDVGWYEFGPKPGQPGSSVLAAHVDLEGQGPGVFFDLQTLLPGDEIEIQYDDGRTKIFKVDASTTYLKEELPLDAIFSRDGPPILTLITCGGGFNSNVGRYDSNVVVYARPVANTPQRLDAE